jgi:catechol 2,3-dioxygenase
MNVKDQYPGVHSIGEFVLTVPDLSLGQHFFESFGLKVSEEGNHLALRVPADPHRWGSLSEGESKRLHHISFHCFSDDLPGFRSLLETQGIRLLNAPRDFDGAGIWFRGHDDILIQIRIGAKTSPHEMAVMDPPSRTSGIRNAPYRRLAGPVHIRRLSHILLFTPDVGKAVDFYSQFLGLRVSDRSGDVLAFLHAIHGSDHHILAFAKSEKPGFHHVSWDVPSVDQIGLGAMTMAEKGYRKCWGTGRHVLGSNYFNYIQDPWGSWSEYSSGIDFIPPRADWMSENHGLDDGFYLWGPDPPPDFVHNCVDLARP